MTTLIIAQLTVQETQRRRILWIALLMGVAFLLFFGVGFHYLYADFDDIGLDSAEANLAVGIMLTAGLYATNFLIILITVITSVTAVSGEVETHTVEALLTKPIARWQLIMGKWLGFAVMLLFYIALLAGGILLIVYWRSGYLVDNLIAGIGLMVLQGLLMLSLTIAGGTRLSSLANGVLVFMLYGIAFIGGWVEQIGALIRNETAVDIGIVASLIMPSEVLWKKALVLFQPQLINTPYMAGPFAIASQPSDLMIGYALLFIVVLLGLAVWSFSTRDL